MTARVLMIQGTASSVGKSMLVAALCRIFANEGVRVAPFKAQNMSNNSCATPDGLEIARAQAEQARAARLAPDVRMNPVLLKPEGERRAQIVLMGRPAGSLSANRFEAKRRLWPRVAAALDSLRKEYELVVIEGAGSPAEINLRRSDIVNMRVARYAQAPVLLVGDIDRGGVFAHFVGTLALLTPAERGLVKGFVINKFRGDEALLAPGIRLLEKRTRRPVLGVVPFLSDLRLAEEDAVALERRGVSGQGPLDVAVIQLPHISNFDDFDALAHEPSVKLRYVRTPAEVSGADLVILPGTKNTRGDLRWLRERGLDLAVARAVEGGAALVGICGGFQMLGRRLSDPRGVEGDPGEDDGLGLLAVETEFLPKKVTRQVIASVADAPGLLAGLAGERLQAYEIHMGVCSVTDKTPFVLYQGSGEGQGRPDGGLSPDGFVLGTYLHGLLANDRLRHTLLQNAARRRGKQFAFPATWDTETEIARLAEVVRQALDLGTLKSIAGL